MGSQKETWRYKWDNPEVTLEELGVVKPLQDFIDKHTQDMNYMLDRHFGGSVLEVRGNVFIIEADSQFKDCDCEIENLVWSGSKFNVDGTIVAMTPIFV